MSRGNKVLWTEGMFLRPQHFQQENRYIETLIEARYGEAVPYSWGFLDLRIDRVGLTQGKLAVEACRGIFPDGTPFDLPHLNPLPPALALDEPVKDSIAYLVLPRRKPDIPEVGARGSKSLARIVADAVDLTDATGAGEEAIPVSVGRLNVSVSLHDSDHGDFTALPMVRIREVRNDGTVILDEEFVPTSLNVESSLKLNEHLRTLQSLVRHRANELAHRVLAPGSGGVGEWSEFLILQILNRHEPLLDHLARMPILHPERLYRHMLGLAGELATYVAQDKRAAEYPAYDHDLPGVPFLQLMDYLRDALTATMVRKAMQLEIQDRGYNIKTVAIPDAKLVTTGRFVLAAKGPLAPEELGSVFPMRLKLGPVEDIVQLVRRNLPGVRVRLVPHRPEEIPYHAGFIYFGLDTHHDLWAKVAESLEFAFHIGGDVRGIDLEMWVIKGED